jgi:histone H3/H4
MAENDLHLASMHRIIASAGAARVSESACIELRQVLEEFGAKVSREALDYTHHAGRKTVKNVDIRIAAKKLLA